MKGTPSAPPKCVDFILASLSPGECELRVLLGRAQWFGFARAQVIWSAAQLLARGEIEMESFGHQDFLRLKEVACRQSHV